MRAVIQSQWVSRFKITICSHVIFINGNWRFKARFKARFLSVKVSWLWCSKAVKHMLNSYWLQYELRPGLGDLLNQGRNVIKPSLTFMGVFPLTWYENLYSVRISIIFMTYFLNVCHRSLGPSHSLGYKSTFFSYSSGGLKCQIEVNKKKRGVLSFNEQNMPRTRTLNQSGRFQGS